MRHDFTQVPVLPPPSSSPTSGNEREPLAGAHATRVALPLVAKPPETEPLTEFEFGRRLPDSYGSTPDGAAVLEMLRTAKASRLGETGQARLLSLMQEDIDSIATDLIAEAERDGNRLNPIDANLIACERWLARRNTVPDNTIDEAFYDALEHRR